ncbi:ribose-phosphate pyrophosphokinase [Buchnera aphidicola]|uniref:Ribose-phosphate pyrophosphokinase n=1 Tax=Buchnera aphidicola (Cinara cf. splendens/pseudotsugae 3390) TaxID=2518980 RepID=A0A451CX53_9GAMM|nr:ribose-phosphate pyrophosphokinase [Buchnera aphidicola]VFP77688.1 Ribose-phosphate pyrophosphokinase [Buchnera aphidicola (Cinara cf. splendens/pseudotsugae 3390)]
MEKIKLFSGNSVPHLAKKIAKNLNTTIGEATVSKFSDGEISIQIHENIRGSDVFLIQSTCSPTNDNVMELIIMIDALRRASAGRITAVIPYFGYARQDRRIRSSRVPITAKVIADFLSNVGVDRILTIDLHAEQIQGFFDVPIDNILSSMLLLKELSKINFLNPVFVSPDIGGIIRTRTIAKLLNDSDMAIIDKRRPNVNVSQVMNIIGQIKNRDCILIDDIIDTGITLCKAAQALKKNGARNIYAYATHPIFSGLATQNIINSCIDKIIVCDTIPVSKKIKNLKKTKIITVSAILAEAIQRINKEESISEMFIY